MSFPSEYGPVSGRTLDKWQRESPIWPDIITEQEFGILVRHRLKNIREESIAAHKERLLDLLNSGVDPESLGLVMKPDGRTIHVVVGDGTETDMEFYRKHFSVRGLNR